MIVWKFIIMSENSICTPILQWPKTDIRPNLTVWYSNTHASSAMSFMKCCISIYFIVSYFSPFTFCPICDSANAVLCMNFWKNQATTIGLEATYFFSISYFSPFKFCPICDSANAVLCMNFWKNQATAIGLEATYFFRFRCRFRMEILALCK